jgi:hypothetical protein
MILSYLLTFPIFAIDFLTNISSISGVISISWLFFIISKFKINLLASMPLAILLALNFDINILISELFILALIGFKYFLDNNFKNFSYYLKIIISYCGAILIFFMLNVLNLSNLYLNFGFYVASFLWLIVFLLIDLAIKTIFSYEKV